MQCLLVRTVGEEMITGSEAGMSTAYIPCVVAPLAVRRRVWALTANLEA